MVAILDTELQELVQRPSATLPTANPNYVGSIAPQGWVAVWKAEDGKFIRLGVPGAYYSPPPEEESLATVVRRKLERTPGDEGVQVEVLNLPPGRFFPRMARPHHQHPADVSVSDRRTVDVADEGPGVPQSLQPRLFEPFSRRSPSAEGCGLGLHLTREIMRTHGGEVWLVPSRRGATFRLGFASPEDESRA